MVRGITVRSRNIVAGIGASLKAVVGGEISTFTNLCEQARKDALSRMLDQAAERGANGVLCVRYDTNCIAPGTTEVLAYGLAVTDSDASTGFTDATDSAHMNSCYVCSSNDCPGLTVHRTLGIVTGITVRSRSVVMAVGAVGKTIVGGEIHTWTKLCDDARQEAYTRMLTEAAALGADGVVAMRYSTNEVKPGITEVIAYGTAVASTPSETSAHAVPASEGLSNHMVTTSSALSSLDTNDTAHTYGIVKGISVRSANIFNQIGAGLKSLAGGEIRTWTAMCAEARAKAFERMLAEANSIDGCKCIVGMRYDATQVAADSGIVEVIAYGTAVGVAPQPLENSSAGVPQHMITTDLQIPRQTFSRTLGLVRGISVQSVHLFRHIRAGFKTIVGGEIHSYNKMCERARKAAYDQMLEHAYAMGATGVVAMRFESNDLVPGSIEVVAYGTAVSDGSRGPVDDVVVSPSSAIDMACLSTTNEVIGQNFERSLGIVRGITCRSRNVFANIGAGLKASFIGGEIGSWNKLCELSFVEATARLTEEAASRGARGIVAMRYETNEICDGIQETIAYGTAVA
jgi:uncharacterized protein YbjQ (UPF0145 family)